MHLMPCEIRQQQREQHLGHGGIDRFDAQV